MNEQMETELRSFGLRAKTSLMRWDGLNAASTACETAVVLTSHLFEHFNNFDIKIMTDMYELISSLGLCSPQEVVDMAHSMRIPIRWYELNGFELLCLPHPTYRYSSDNLVKISETEFLQDAKSRERLGSERTDQLAGERDNAHFNVCSALSELTFVHGYMDLAPDMLLPTCDVLITGAPNRNTQQSAPKMSMFRLVCHDPTTQSWNYVVKESCNYCEGYLPIGDVVLGQLGDTRPEDPMFQRHPTSKNNNRRREQDVVDAVNNIMHFTQ